MREPTYVVLASLLDGPLHGYAISTAATRWRAEYRSSFLSWRAHSADSAVTSTFHALSPAIRVDV